MGIPNQIVTDNGPQFTATEFEEFYKNNGINRTLTAPYHPNLNGEAEHFVQTFKTTMQKEKGEVQLNLSKFLLHYRTTPHSATGKSPAEPIFGRQIKTRLDLLHPDEIKQTKPKKKDQRTSRLMRRYVFETIMVPPPPPPPPPVGSLELSHRKLILAITL